MQQRAAEWQHLFASAVSQPAEVADAGKAPGQHVLQEAAQELFGGKCHGALLAVVSIVLPTKGDLPLCNREQSMVGDGNAVGIACQVMKHMLGAAKRRLGVDDPVLPAQSV